MAKEELEKEKILKYKHYSNNRELQTAYEWGYKDGAEPREKKIKSLGKRCLQLQKDKGNLTDRVKELEAQIEKMRNCSNCKKSCIGYKNCTLQNLAY